MKYKSGESFIDNIYQNLINSVEVKNAISRKKNKISSREDAIKTYMDRIEKAHSTERKLTLLKSLYHKRYVIDHLPESYIKNYIKTSRNRGMGNIVLSDEEKDKKLEEIRNNQKKTLDAWLDYLNKSDYPMWFKYYVFNGMIKLGEYSDGKFKRRGKNTVSPFAEINKSALNDIYIIISNTVNDDIHEINIESFGKLYGLLIKRNTETNGIWKKYVQGSDYKNLWKSLQGMNTGWCTAWLDSEECEKQLSGGDFYVYYTKDEDGNYNIPRIAIRMTGKNIINEVRGISNNQNLEPEMVKIAEEKLSDFPGKIEYDKKIHDMDMLTIIESKTLNGEDLSKDEIKFLYEVNSKIVGFGHMRDPRIEEIKEKRNIKKDLSYLFDCEEENIGSDIRDFDWNNIIVYIGNLDINDEIVFDKYRYLKVVLGDLRFNSLISSNGLSNLEYISGNAYFKSLEDATSLTNLKSIGLSAYFNRLKNSLGLDSLSYIGEVADFSSLDDANHLVNLKYIGNNASFISLKDSKGLENLYYIGGNAFFRSLENAKGLEGLYYILGGAYFLRLYDSIGLENLRFIGNLANFPNLISAKGFKNLKNIGENASFPKLQTLDGLNVQTIGGTAIFEGLINTNGMEYIEAKSFVLPEELNTKKR